MGPARSFGLLITLLASLQATTLERLSLDDMTAKSTAIVDGRVLSSYVIQNGPLIFTHFKVQVLEQWKGVSAAEVDVAVPGGMLGRKTQTVAGAPALQAGTEYIFFLWTGKSDITQIIGLSQGVMGVTTTSAGTKTVNRAAPSDAMVDSSGRPAQASGFQMSLSDLRSRVAQTLVAGAKR
jgi:hypothetical protein